MDKVIKIKVTKIQSNSRCQEYMIKIIEQSYIRCDFGNPDESFISSKGFTLRSVNSPAISGGHRLYVRGDCRYSNNDALSIGADYLIKVMHAVREYNSHLIITNLLAIPDKESFIIE